MADSDRAVSNAPLHGSGDDDEVEPPAANATPAPAAGNRYRPGPKARYFGGFLRGPYARGHIFSLDQMSEICFVELNASQQLKAAARVGALLARAPALGLCLVFLYGDRVATYLACTCCPNISTD